MNENEVKTKDPYYGLDAETSYMKEGVITPLKTPKIKIEGRTLEENKKYPITLLKTVETREITSKQPKTLGKTYKFYQVFVKYTGTDYTFVAEIGEILANQLNKYPPQTKLALTKEWIENKKGHKVPIVKIEMDNLTPEQEAEQQRKIEDDDSFLDSAYKSFIAEKDTTQKTKYAFIDFYSRLNGGALDAQEEEKAKRYYETQQVETIK